MQSGRRACTPQCVTARRRGNPIVTIKHNDKSTSNYYNTEKEIATPPPAADGLAMTGGKRGMVRLWILAFARMTTGG